MRRLTRDHFETRRRFHCRWLLCCDRACIRPKNDDNFRLAPLEMQKNLEPLKLGIFGGMLFEVAGECTRVRTF